MGHDLDSRLLESVDESRRDLLRKLILGSAFVVPAVASFPMDGLAADKPTMRNGNLSLPLASGKAAPAGTPVPGKPSEPAKR